MRGSENFWLMERKKIFGGCFAASLFLHVAALLCFQRYSLWFSAPQTAQNPENWLSLVDKQERDQILRAAFEPAAPQKKEKESALRAQKEEIVDMVIRSSVQTREPEFDDAVSFQFSFTIQEQLLASPVLPTFSIPSQSFNLLDHLPKDLIIPAPSKQTQPMFHPLPNHSALTLSGKPPTVLEATPAAPIVYSDKIDLALTESPQIGKAPTLIPLPNLPKLPSLDDLETSSYSDSFDADLVFLPREDGKGYIFALTLIPQPDLKLPKLNQRITFLIDRSNSIQQGRLNATKAAVHKALEELSSEDTFNIIAFDSKMEKMSPNDLPCMGKAYALAESFLEKIQLGSFFAASDLYKPLFLTVPGYARNDEVHTAILLTDGESFAKKAAQRAVLHDWTQYNGGKVTLFAVGMNDSHMETLDAAAAFNRGKVINAPTHRGLKRKLQKLIKTIQHPVAKNLACHAISRSPQSKIQIYPKSSQMPHLYLDQPYVILGETDTLDDFILFIQGRLKDRWLNVKKTISFLNARKGNKTLKQELALQNAYHLYEQYVLDDNPKHIADAKALLEPYDFQAVFR
jgi:hypothetical protein